MPLPDILREILLLLGLLHESRPGLLSAAPIEFSTYAGEDPTGFTLRIEDGQGNLVSELKSSDAVSSEDGFLSFNLVPVDLPETIVLRQSSPFGHSFVVGPCDPIDLGKALESGDFDSLDRFLQEPLPPVPDPGPTTTLFPSDDDYQA